MLICACDPMLCPIHRVQAEERKRDELSDKDVKNAQQRMSSEIAFDFNFN